MPAHPLTVTDVALALNCRPWQVRRVFERKLLPEPRRIRRYRIFWDDDLPAIERILRQIGYLPARKEVAGAAH
jgi:hypothetical protein